MSNRHDFFEALLAAYRAGSYTITRVAYEPSLPWPKPTEETN